MPTACSPTTRSARTASSASGCRDRGGTRGLHEDLPQKLKAMDSLPATVKERLDREAMSQPWSRPSPVRMPWATTLGESSWGVLRIWPARPVSCRPSAGWTSWRTCGASLRATPSQSSWLLVVQHRFYPLLQYLALPRREGVPALTAMAGRLDLAESGADGATLDPRLPGPEPSRRGTGLGAR